MIPVKLSTASVIKYLYKVKQFLMAVSLYLCSKDTNSQQTIGPFDGLTGSKVGCRFIGPGFKPQPGYVRRLFHLSLCLITFGGHSADLAYLVHIKVAIKQQHLH